MRNPKPGERWAIMGGIFDPIHFGHLRLAESARDTFKLDGVLFVVSFDPPHRQSKPICSFEERVRMTALGLSDSADFVLSEIEAEMSVDRYTINLIGEIQTRYPEVDWHLILGGDNIAIFDSWYKPGEVAEAVKLIVGHRPGYEAEINKSRWKSKFNLFEMQQNDISSTDIRNLISSGRSIRYLLPDMVRQFILKEGFYR